MIGLPANSSTAMLYAPRRFRGLGLLRCSWEAPLQHWSIAQKLARVQDSIFQAIFSYDEEVMQCSGRLGLDVVSMESTSNIRTIRRNLRENSFEEWARNKWQGIGVIHFKDYPRANNYICNRQLLSGSEWTNSIKLNTNYAPLKAVPGVSGLNVGNVAGSLCRKCCREPETPAHVLGKCPANGLLITRRHHNVKKRIAELLTSKGWTCLDEVYCIDTDGSTRYVDILAFSSKTKSALVIDPTVRYESNEPEQGKRVDAEKKSIYEKCIPYLREKFHEEFGDRSYEVTGLWFGARGTIPDFTAKFFKLHGIDSDLPTISEKIIIDSIGIIHHHIYS
ncbi:uncharacterized protein LOC128882229 [Hylaeus volcanicus]|uniref:uncharacterized protein LOC128882229 n=1 Tax=Hylaeus volcanicus TaxID=313075 RepID=UPI0023B80118|nr:uncharacterized protein LOC128882229 [Hylaeus volcanicus]